ncbi:MAG: MipA/OmpV family protein [Campylobacterota bacterium]|nr:MipA/OmpV family protein [Campylobacterota bacterium]
MMKKLLLAILVTLSLNAGDNVVVGAGVYSHTQPYKGMGEKVIPTPVFFFDNALFYARWAQFGVYFLGDKKDDLSWGFSLTAQPNPYGYSSSDSSYLIGMEDRKSSWEGGIDFIMESKKGWFELTYFHDILGVTQSNSYVAQVGTTFHLGDFRFDPIAVARYNDSKYNNYYYGVRANEATFSRAYYEAKGAMVATAQTYITYPISKHFVIISNFRADYLGSEISKSSITDTNARYSGMLSIAYKFSYSKTKDYFFGR